MNRLLTVLKKRRRKKLLCVYLTLGFPTLAATEKLIPLIEASGCDILELGFPFSDPLADGPTIQQASERALKNGVTMHDAFSVISKLRKAGLKIPVIFFTYLNPVLHYGPAALAASLKGAGFDGVLIPDLTYDEGEELRATFHRQGLTLTYLIAPTTDPDRMKKIALKSDGFIYYVSLRGVTGARRQVPAELASQIKRVKRASKKPVLVGFGVSTPAHARAIVKNADGVIVGSALIEVLKGANFYESAPKFVRQMAEAIKR